MKNQAIVSLLFLLVVATDATRRCHLRGLDMCVSLGSGREKIPTTEAGIDKQCEVIKEVDYCIGNYTQECTTPTTRDLIGMLSAGAREVQDKYCTPGNQLRTDFLKHAPCLVKAQIEGRFCLNDAKTGLQTLEKAKFSDRVATACCVYGRHSSCAKTTVETICGKAAVEYANVLMQLATSNMFNVMCKGFIDNSECATLVPPPGTKSNTYHTSVVSRLFEYYSLF